MADPLPTPAPERVRLVRPDGKHVLVDATGADALVEAGYEVPSAEQVATYDAEKQYGDQGLRAGAEGLARGVTFGLSDIAQGALLDNEADILGRQQAFPTLSTATEVAGAIAPALLTGGTSAGVSAGAKGAGLATKAALLTPAGATAKLALGAESLVARGVENLAAKGVLGKAAAAAAKAGAQGAVEGALYGAGQRVSQDFLSDTEITAERILVGAGEGALLGALGGAAVGGGTSLLADGAREAAEAAMRQMHAETVQDFASSRAVKAVMGGRNQKQLNLLTRRDTVEDAGQFFLDSGLVKATSTVEDIARDASTMKQAAGATIGDIIERADVPVDGTEIGVRVLDEVLAPLRQNKAAGKIADSLQAKIDDWLNDLPNARNASELWQKRRDLDDVINFDKASAPPGAAGLFEKELLHARSVVEDEVQNAVKRAAEQAGDPAMFDNYLTQKKAYARFSWAEKTANDAVKRELNNRMFSASDYGMGATYSVLTSIAGGGVSPATLALGFVGGAIHNVIRERGSAFLAGTINAAGKRMRPAGLSNALAGEVAVENTAAKFIESLRTGGKRVKAVAPDVGAVIGVDAAADTAIVYEAVQRKAAELQDRNSPTRRKVSGQLAGVAMQHPALAEAHEAQLDRAGAFLAGKATRATRGGPSVFSEQRKPRVSPREANKLRRYAYAVDNPRAVLRRVADGTVTAEELEALKAVYPRMHQQLVNRVLEQMHEVDKLPDYQSRVRLSALLGVPTDPTLQPDFVAAMQESAQANRGQISEPGQSPGILSPSRRTAPELAGQAATPTQSLAMRR